VGAFSERNGTTPSVVRYTGIAAVACRYVSPYLKLALTRVLVSIGGHVEKYVPINCRQVHVMPSVSICMSPCAKLAHNNLSLTQKKEHRLCFCRPALRRSSMHGLWKGSNVVWWIVCRPMRVRCLLTQVPKIHGLWMFFRPLIWDTVTVAITHKQNTWPIRYRWAYQFGIFRFVYNSQE